MKGLYYFIIGYLSKSLEAINPTPAVITTIASIQLVLPIRTDDIAPITTV